MRKILGFCAAAVLALWASPASATPTNAACAAINGGGAGGVNVSGAYLGQIGNVNGGCNVLITFNANGSIVTTNPNTASSYDDGNDDNMVGIVNLTANPIFDITFNSTGGSFGFDGDGVCDATWTFAGANPCTGKALGGVSSYGPLGVTFTVVDANNGTVHFAGGIASQSASFFSLEGPVDKNLQVRPVPEPASLLLFGTGALALARRRRRKQ